VKLSASTSASEPHDLMSRGFFGLLKTSETPEDKGIFALFWMSGTRARNPPGPDRP
jgi:hypothetical protein